MKSLAWILLSAGALAFGGCGTGEKASIPAQKLVISCDETFKPVIDAQLKVFSNINPDITYSVYYKPEASCLQDLYVDSVNLIIATRQLSEGESLSVSDSLKLEPKQAVVARDLIAVLLNPQNPDSFFSLQKIKNLLTGASKSAEFPVFDGNRATSTVRYMMDSVLKGASLGTKVTAAENSRAVIDYVARYPDAVGFVGYSWIGNYDDTAQRRERGRINMAWVESTDSAGYFVKPSQFFIYTGSYPLVRDLVCISKEKNPGPAQSFARFLQQDDKGQLIFRRSYLMPVIRPHYIRNAELRDSINN